MKLNPFDEQLKKAELKALELSNSLKNIQSQIDWYTSTEIEVLAENVHAQKTVLNKKKLDYDGLLSEATKINSVLSSRSASMKSLWNPMNWFDSKQRELRFDVAVNKKALEVLKNKANVAKEHLKDLAQQILDKNKEIERYKDFDFDVKTTEHASIRRQLSQQKIYLQKISDRKQQVDNALAPILKQILDAEKKKVIANSIKSQAERYDEELSNARNSYERAIVHQDCDEIFGTGSPKKVVSQKASEVRRLDRDIEKLMQRAKMVADKASRHIQKLVLDGNNLCYQGDVFIGFSALKSLVPILSKEYKIVLVFDASIRRLLGMGDSDIRNALGNDIPVHIVATGVKADETIIDIAGGEKTTFIVSNDRFAEFNDKPALKDQRVIRHEIVSGQVLIHDLGISGTYEQ
jgi:archaellum component FlaC